MWAAGNGGARGDSCAADGYVNSIYTIAVGSADEGGSAAYFDEQCSAKLIVSFNHDSTNGVHMVSLLFYSTGSCCYLIIVFLSQQQLDVKVV